MLSLVYNITATMSSVFVMLFKQVNNQVIFICEVLMNNKIIGQRINEALAFRNVKQKELAKELGVKDNVVSYWCSGTRTPNVQQIIQISKILNVSADYLLGSSEAKTSNIELKAICDYTGLTEEAVNKLHELCTPEKCDNIDDKILFDEEFAKKSAAENKKIINDFLSSKEFEYIVCMACNLSYIDENAFKCLALFFKDFDKFNKLNQTEKNQDLLKSIKYFVNEYENEPLNNALQDKCDLTLFKIQRSITAHFKKMTKVLNQIEDDNLVPSFDLLRFFIANGIDETEKNNFNIEFFKDFITKSYNIENRQDDFAKLKEIYERYKDE